MKHINAILWDMDGVKYSFEDSFRQHFHETISRIAARYLPGLEHETGVTLARESYKKYQSCWDFLHIEHGVDRSTLQDEFHAAININFMIPLSAEYFAEMQKSGVKHGILTHGHRPWLQRIFEKVGLTDKFQPEFITTDEEVYPYKKSKNTEPYVIALKKMGATPQETVMVEDSQINLKAAKSLGMTTVLVHNQKNEPQADYTDYIFDTPYDFLVTFNEMRRK